MADISVIIPCFNTAPGFLQEAVNSVLAYQGRYQYEIIITDDGSVNSATLQLLKELEKQNVKVLYQENKGPAAARNTGVRFSSSEYILFLDSDNKIKPGYIDEGIAALTANPKAAVAYSKPGFFGDARTGEFSASEFDIQKMLVNNYIDMCAVVRHCAWEAVGGLDESRVLIGHEDWEFWICLYKANWKFVYIEKVLFDYRLRNGSLITRAIQKKAKAIEYVYAKHPDVVYSNFNKLYTTSLIYEQDKQKPFRSFIKYAKAKFFR